jgi:hypothetical protein
MRRHGRLQGVANSFLSHFVSRNNDAGGYWALGEIYSYTVDLGMTTLELDMKAIGRVDRDVLNRALEQRAAVLARLLELEGFVLNDMTDARVTLEFRSPETGLTRKENFGRGDLARCSVRLVSKGGLAATASVRFRVEPHRALA